MGNTPPPGLETHARIGATSTVTVHAGDPLKSIFVYVDETDDVAARERTGKRGGTITFVSVAGKKVAAMLTRNWFPAGTWELSIGSQEKARPSRVIDSFKCLFPENADPAAVAALNERGKHDDLLQFRFGKEQGADIKRLLASSQGRKVRLIVTYSRAQTGNAKTLPDTFPLTDEHTKVLGDEAVAKLYLQFVEHFGGVTVDYSLAKDGLTEDEVKQVEQNRPEVIAVTNLFTQGFAEFNQSRPGAPAPPPTLDNFRAMEETIFYQRGAKNDLAARGMLAISMGHLLFTKEDGSKATRPDIGVVRRTAGAGGLLLYDRDGAAVRGIVGYLDTEFRSTDMRKVTRDTSIPLFEIQVPDKALYSVLRSLEQNIGHPTREVEALAASLYKHSLFITNEIRANYSQELADRIMEVGKAVIVFFVVHAIAAHLARTGHPAAVAFLVLVKAAGLILGVDGVLMDMEKAAAAGRHFAQMEVLHRGEPGEKPKLTELSKAHLHAGTEILIDVIADFVMFVGVILVGVGVKQGLKLGRAIREARSRVPDAKARIELGVDKDGVADSIKTKEPREEIRAPAPKEGEGSGGLETPSRTVTGPPPETRPIEEPNAGVDQGKKHGQTPEQQPFARKVPRSVEMSPADFASDKAAQAELFEACKAARARQEAMMQGLLKRLGIKATFKSILKREAFAEFVDGVISKARDRKGYKTIGEMPDMIRGRVNVEDPADVERLVDALEDLPEAKRTRGPQTRRGVEQGYPRHHVEVADSETGIEHEWQIGTEATTHLYEKPGIDVGDLRVKPENTNIHDIEYDIFKSIDEPADKLPALEQAELRALSEKVRIPEFRTKVAKLSAKTGTEAMDRATLEAEIDALHREASEILRALVREKGGKPRGVEFLQKFLH